MGSRFAWAPTAYKLLDGVFCIFKPPECPIHKIVETIQTNLTKGLNALPCYQHEIPLKTTKLKENATETGVSTVTGTQSIQDWSEHRLVLGTRYQESDFDIQWVDGVLPKTSGVLVMGIGNRGHDAMHLIGAAKYLRVYHLKGRFGWSADDFTATGKVLERVSYRHVTHEKLIKVCSMVQAAYTNQMHELSGVDPDSHEAYEMASSSGIIRPSSRYTTPLLYGVRCINYQPPDFTLEVHCINEASQLLARLIHDIAIDLKTGAVCSGLRRVRYGHFDLQRALVEPQWHVDNIVDNIMSNNELLTPEKLLLPATGEKVRLLPPRQGNKLLSENENVFLHEDVNQSEIDSENVNNLSDESGGWR